VAWAGSSCQLSFCLTSAPLEPRSSKVGSARTSLRPALASDGPTPRIATFFGTLPVTINPPIMTRSPVSTRSRVEMFKAWAGVGEGDAVGVGVTVGVGGGVAVGVGLGVGGTVALGVGVAVAGG